jgi:hypothetical protein
VLVKKVVNAKVVLNAEMIEEMTAEAVAIEEAADVVATTAAVEEGIKSKSKCADVLIS